MIYSSQSEVFVVALGPYKGSFCAHLMKKQNATKARLVSSSSRKLSMKLFCHMMSKWKAYAAAKVSKVDKSACAPAEQNQAVMSQACAESHHKCVMQAHICMHTF